MRLNAALALKLTPPTAVRWSFVSSLFFFFLSFHIFFGVMRMVVVFLHWPFFLRCFPFHLALVVSVACFFFFCFVIHTNLFFVFVFRTFFKRSAQFVRLFVRLFIAAGLHSIFIQQFCFCAISSFLFFLQNYYYFIKVLYYLCTDAHFQRVRFLSCAHGKYIVYNAE